MARVNIGLHPRGLASILGVIPLLEIAFRFFLPVASQTTRRLSGRMNSRECRVHSLKLRGDDSTQFSSARYCLEEAFRTASMSGFPPNAQVFVRYMDLGSFQVGKSPTWLSNRLSDTLRDLAAGAVCVDHHTSVANVVWFSDLLQAYKMLLARLLGGVSTSEWYWRNVLPNKTLVSSSVTLEALLIRVAETPLKGLATARVLDGVLDPPRMTRLLSFITVDFARRMLNEYGLSPVAVAQVSAEQPNVRHGRDIAPPKLSLSWRTALQQAMQTWGEQDVRSLWLAWHALILYRPAYMERADTLPRIVLGDWIKAWSCDKLNLPNQEKPVAASGLGKAIPADGSSANLASIVQPNLGSLQTITTAPSEVTADTLTISNLPSKQTPVHTDSSNDAVTTAQPKPAIEPELRPSERPAVVVTHIAVTQISPLAGLAFAIPLLQRLGMPELLTRNASLVATDFPRLVLWSLTQRFGGGEGDPLFPLFADLETLDDITIAPFHTPTSWQRLFTARDLRSRATNARDEHSAIRLSALINTLQLLGARYLRRHAGLSWRTLVNRPGRVLLTSTHWDVIFDINQTDLRLRRIALDSNPGWVAWLGRVVQIHYDKQGERYV